jgi:multicomponent Na+:H+ antiporter subunit D
MNHALFKSALFLGSGSLERIAGTRKLSEMGGLARRAPWTTAGAMGASLAIAGVPPFNGFWSKLLVLVALFQAGWGFAGAVAAVTAVLTLVTFVQVQRRAFFGALPARLAAAREVPASMAAPVLVLSFLCLVVVVLWPLGVGDMVRDAATAVADASGEGGALDRYVRLVPGRLP